VAESGRLGSSARLTRTVILRPAVCGNSIESIGEIVDLAVPLCFPGILKINYTFLNALEQRIQINLKAQVDFIPVQTVSLNIRVASQG
jgi:hypothetical protein